MNGTKDECKKIRIGVGWVRKSRGCQLMKRHSDDESDIVAMMNVMAWRVVSRLMLWATKSGQDQPASVAGQFRTMGIIIELPK